MARKRKKKQKSTRKTAKRRQVSKNRDETPLPDMRVFEAARCRAEWMDSGRDDDSSIARAQEIVYKAFEAEGPQQVELAREALAVCPDCADAYVLLAEQAADLNQAIELYREGVAAGERALGKDTFEHYAGEFWEILETRPYMRAKMGLAQCLWAAARREASVEHYQQMLRLNPLDNQGVRWVLAKCLVELERDDDLKRLLTEYPEDSTAAWTYTKTLLTFRQQGDSEDARTRLAEAAKCNKHVPVYLLGDVPMPRRIPGYFSPGGEDEAILYAAEFLLGWKATPGAISWLRKAAKVGLPKSGKRPPRLLPAAKRALMDLPQIEGELWQADIRRLSAVVEIAGEKTRPWAMLVTNCSENEIPALEMSRERPSDEMLCELLVQAMLDPVTGDPHRPKTIQLSTKKRCNAWRSDLADLEIGCTYRKPLEHVDRILDQIEPFLPEDQDSQRPLAEGLGDRRVAGEVSDLLELPQKAGEVWQADIFRMHTWVEAGGEPTRPWVVLVTDSTNDLVLAHDLSDRQPNPEALWEKLSEAMKLPMVDDSHRPGEVQLRSEDHRNVVGPQLEEIDIRCVVSDELDQLDATYESLANHLVGKSPIPALVDLPGIGLEQVGCYFEAAARFYQRAPWRLVPGDTVIRVECEKFESKLWHAVVMGQSGMTLGLALHDDLEALRRLFSGDLSDEESFGRTSALSVTFDEEFTMAIPDLEAAEQFGWPVATPEAYPCAIRVDPGRVVRPPLAWELEFLEGCLRAIPEFLAEEHLPRQRIQVPTASGPLELVLSWPDEDAA